MSKEEYGISVAAFTIALGLLSIVGNLVTSVRARIEIRLRNGRVFDFDTMGEEPEEQILMVHAERQEEDGFPIVEAQVIAIDGAPTMHPLEEHEDEHVHTVAEPI